MIERDRISSSAPRRIITISLLVAAATIWVNPGQDVAHARPPLSGRAVVFGAHVEDGRPGSLFEAQRRFEALIDHRINAVRVYLRWDSSFPNDYVRWLKRTHRTIVLSIKAMHEDGTIVPWRAIADAEPGSDIYSTMVHWAHRIRRFDRRVYLVFNHEPESRVNAAMGSAQDFVAAWRRFVGVFREVGVGKVSWVWTMTDWAFETTDWRAARYWYPGKDYVDFVGADLYNYGDCAVNGQTWMSFRRKLSPIRTWARRHGRRIILPEWGTTEDPSVPGHKANWIRDARHLLEKRAWHRVRMVLYFERLDPAMPHCNWPVTSSATALSAFSHMAADPYFERRV